MTTRDLKLGDTVKLITRRHGDHTGNPVWGLSQGHVTGIVYKINPRDTLSVKVRWDNGSTNSYAARDLELTKAVMVIKNHFTEDLFTL